MAQAAYPEAVGGCPPPDGPPGIKRFPIWPCTARSLPGRDLLPDTPVSSYLTLSPITCKQAGLLSVALVVTPLARGPGRYPARRPMVFGLSSCVSASDHPTRFVCQGSESITKYVEHSNIMLRYTAKPFSCEFPQCPRPQGAGPQFCRP